MEKSVYEDSYNELLAKVNELAEKYNYTVSGRPRTVSALKLLTSNVCEEKIQYDMKLKDDYSEDIFDSIYAERSSFATNFIIDALKSALYKEGYMVGIITEQKSDVGRYDVVIEKGNPCVVYSNHKVKKIRIEVKASFGLPFEQLQRYLFDPSPLILVRVLTGQVILLDPSSFYKFLDFSTQTLLEKANRILDGKGYLVRGPHCLECRNSECPFYPAKEKTSHRLVKIKDDDLEWEMDLFFNNLPKVSSRLSELVLGELRSD